MALYGPFSCMPTLQICGWWLSGSSELWVMGFPCRWFCMWPARLWIISAVPQLLLLIPSLIKSTRSFVFLFLFLFLFLYLCIHRGVCIIKLTGIWGFGWQNAVTLLYIACGSWVACFLGGFYFDFVFPFLCFFQGWVRDWILDFARFVLIFRGLLLVKNSRETSHKDEG